MVRQDGIRDGLGAKGTSPLLGHGVGLARQFVVVPSAARAATRGEALAPGRSGAGRGGTAHSSA